MILTNPEVQTIYNTVLLCDKLGIDSLIIEPNRVRAIDEAKNLVIIQSTGIQPMSFQNIGFNRIPTFIDRYTIVSALPNFSIEVTTKETNGTTWAQSLLLKGKGTKIEYRCANPLTIQAPKELNDLIITKSKMSSDTLAALQRGQTAMRASVFTLRADDKGLFVVINDTTRDTMELQIDRPLFDSNGTLVTFTHKYPGKPFLLPFKLNTSGMFDITSRGLLISLINNLAVYTIPE